MTRTLRRSEDPARKAITRARCYKSRFGPAAHDDVGWPLPRRGRGLSPAPFTAFANVPGLGLSGWRDGPHHCYHEQKQGPARTLTPRSGRLPSGRRQSVSYVSTCRASSCTADFPCRHKAWAMKACRSSRHSVSTWKGERQSPALALVALGKRTQQALTWCLPSSSSRQADGAGNWGLICHIQSLGRSSAPCPGPRWREEPRTSPATCKVPMSGR